MFRCLRMRFALLVLTSMSLCGCGGGGNSGPKTVAVSGVVTLGGKPLAGAEVHFGKNFTGFGKTNTEGKYELVQGAVPGDNKIIITKIEGGEGLVMDSEAGMDAEQLRAAASDRTAKKADAAKIPKEVVPAEYSDPAKSKLSFPVPESGAVTADFKL